MSTPTHTHSLPVSTYTEAVDEELQGFKVQLHTPTGLDGVLIGESLGGAGGDGCGVADALGNAHLWERRGSSAQVR